MSDDVKEEVTETPKKAPKEKAAPRKKSVMVKAWKIASSGKSVLVEYLHAGRYARCYVPSEALLGDMVALDELQAGIPYGVDWSAIGPLSLDPVEMDVELKRQGIYTHADMQSKPRETNITLARLGGAVKSKLVEFAKEQEA